MIDPGNERVRTMTDPGPVRPDVTVEFEQLAQVEKIGAAANAINQEFAKLVELGPPSQEVRDAARSSYDALDDALTALDNWIERHEPSGWESY